MCEKDWFRKVCVIGKVVIRHAEVIRLVIIMTNDWQYRHAVDDNAHTPVR